MGSRKTTALQGTTNNNHYTEQIKIGMALFHFKQEVMEEQNMKQNKEFNSNVFFHGENNSSDIFTSKTNKEHHCGRNNPNVMLGGINLGDIMRQTVMEEMRLIRNENGLNLQRLGGRENILNHQNEEDVERRRMNQRR